MKYFCLGIFTLLISLLQGQYISRSQPAPSYTCPTLCPGSDLILEVFQVQNLNTGDTLLAVLSNASGSFSSGTTTLSCTGYSTDMGANWNNGPYLFSSNVNNLYFSITIPANTPRGSNYTILMKSSSGYTSADQFQCGGSNYITVISAYPVLPPLPVNTEGYDHWVASLFGWSVTPDATSKILNTDVLINEQDFFDTARYKGYFFKDSLSFDINYLTASGGTCPGVPGTLNDGTSIPCAEGFSTNFSIRMLRKQNFPSGTYQLSVQGDDGIRLSIDGGNTWLLNAFYEQVYDTSLRSTASAYPGGICLSGPTALVIEYFQRNVDSRITFTATLLSSTSIGDAGNQSGCTGSDVAFQLSNSSNSLSYQWYYSTNAGSTFVPVPNSAPFSGIDSSTLRITSLPASYNNYLFRCQVSGLCSNPVNTAVDTLFVGGNGAPATLTANKNNICANDSATICAPANCSSYMWNTDDTTQCITTSLAGNYYATVTYNTGCTANSNHLSIAVFPVPSVSITVQGDTLTDLSGVTQQWYHGNNPVSGATSKVYIAPGPGVYSVLITDTNGCQEMSSPVNVGETGISEISSPADFALYPNPLMETGQLLVVVQDALIGKDIKIYDAVGQLIMQTKIESAKTELNHTALACGVYFVRIEVATKRFVRE